MTTRTNPTETEKRLDDIEHAIAQIVEGLRTTVAWRPEQQGQVTLARIAKDAHGTHSRMGTKRAVIVLDGEGIVRYRHDHRLGLDFQTVDELRSALDAVPAHS